MRSLERLTSRLPVATVVNPVPLSDLSQTPTLILTASLLILGTICFGISYTHLLALAGLVGMTGLNAVLWPLCLDAFMIASAFYVIARKAQGYPADLARIGVFIVTIISMFFNAYVAPRTLISIFTFVLPPMFLYFLFEMVLNVLNFERLFRASPESPAPPALTEAERFPVPIISNNSRLTNLDPIVDYVVRNPTASISQIARDLGVPRTTMSRRLKTLVACGMIPSRGGPTT